MMHDLESIRQIGQEARMGELELKSPRGYDSWVVCRTLDIGQDYQSGAQVGSDIWINPCLINLSLEILPRVEQVLSGRMQRI